MLASSNNRAYSDIHPSRILVTGGGGFIGSHSVELLLDQGYQVRVLDNFSNGSKDNLPIHHPNMELMIGDICNCETVDIAMDNIHSCLHLAAQVSAPLSVQKPSESAWRNIIGFINIIDACKRHDVKKLVYASSAAVYGDPAELPLSEHSPKKPINPYGLEKLVDEYYADLYYRLHGCNAIGLRYFNVYGPRQDPKSPYSGVISKFLECLIANQSPTIFGDGSQTRDFIYVYDIARTNVMALKSNFTGFCNVGSGCSINLIELFEVLRDCIGANVDPVFEPAREGDIKNSCAENRVLKNKLHISPAWNLHSGLADLVNTFSQVNLSRDRQVT